MIARLRSFRRSEDGSSTIEFVMFLPFFLALFLATFELGMLLTRQVMLDRGVDMTVRQVRLGTIAPLTHDTLKEAICGNAEIIPACMRQIKLEMRRVDPRGWTDIPRVADCVDRFNPAEPVTSFDIGTSNELMVLRVCALFDPYFPTSGLASQVARQNGGAYALVSTTAFVIEPRS